MKLGNGKTCSSRKPVERSAEHTAWRGVAPSGCLALSGLVPILADPVSDYAIPERQIITLNASNTPSRTPTPRRPPKMKRSPSSSPARETKLDISLPSSPATPKKPRKLPNSKDVKSPSPRKASEQVGEWTAEKREILISKILTAGWAAIDTAALAEEVSRGGDALVAIHG